MKKTLLLLAALAFTTAGTSFAQTAPAAAKHYKARTAKAAKSPAQKSDRHAAKMAKDLGLSADQEARVEQLLVARQQESAAFKAKYGTDKKAGRNEKRAAHDRYESQLRSILSADQYAKLGQLKAERRSNAKLKDGGKMKMKAKA